MGPVHLLLALEEKGKPADTKEIKLSHSQSSRIWLRSVITKTSTLYVKIAATGTVKTTRLFNANQTTAKPSQACQTALVSLLEEAHKLEQNMEYLWVHNKLSPTIRFFKKTAGDGELSCHFDLALFHSRSGKQPIAKLS